jgi:uncharacterized protein (DUF433 family)
MRKLTRITFDTNVMGGRPCLRGLRVTVETLVGPMAAGYSVADILKSYQYLEQEDIEDIIEDINEALAYAAWRAEEIEVPLTSG